MKYIRNNTAVEDIKIAYIGGGSRDWARKLFNDLALEDTMNGTVHLYDINFQAACNNAIVGKYINELEETKSDWEYKAVPEISEALLGADFVIISILPGAFDEMDIDVHMPEEYGIYQSVGDTAGPGGCTRALRTIPMYVEIAENIKKYSPKAWVINYTNPMSMCTRVLYKVFPKIKAFGCCHEVFGTQDLLAEVIKRETGIENVKRDEIEVNVLGINHFTWVDQAYYKGMDLFPIYRKFIDKNFEEFQDGFRSDWGSSPFKFAELVKFDLFKRYGLIAAAGDRHLAEFMPGNWYLKDKETVSNWKFHLTPVSWRKENRKKQDKEIKQIINKEKPVELKHSGEEGVQQIRALLGLGNIITNVNLPNKGQMQGLPKEVIVETNALFSKDSIKPIMAGRLPEPIEAITMRHILNQETIVKGALEKDKELVFRGFINDPLVMIQPNESRELFDKMIDSMADYVDLK